MEEKILNILLDMQVDIKDLKVKVINIEEKELPGIKASIKDIQERELPGIKESIKDIQERELPGIKESIKDIQEKELPSIKFSISNIEDNELPAIRKQRLIDSNNIAKILSLQTDLNQRLSINNQRKNQIINY